MFRGAPGRGRTIPRTHPGARKPGRWGGRWWRRPRSPARDWRTGFGCSWWQPGLVESRDVDRLDIGRLAIGQIALDAGLPVLDGHHLIVLAQENQVTDNDVERDQLAALSQRLRSVGGGGRLEHDAAGAGDPVVLLVLPFALDRVDDYRARMVVLGQFHVARGLEQGDGLAADWVA